MQQQQQSYTQFLIYCNKYSPVANQCIPILSQRWTVVTRVHAQATYPKPKPCSGRRSTGFKRVTDASALHLALGKAGGFSVRTDRDFVVQTGIFLFKLTFVLEFVPLNRGY